MSALARAQSQIARDTHLVTLLGDRFRPRQRAIQVDDQARLAAENQRAVEPGAEAVRHRRRARIQSNVSGQLFAPQSQIPQGPGDPVGRVVKRQNEANGPVALTS